MSEQNPPSVNPVPARPFSRRTALSFAAPGGIAATLRTAPQNRDMLRVTAVQSCIRAVDAANPRQRLKENLDHMLEFVDNANGFPGPQDLVCVHEQPLMGWNPWTRAEALRLSIEVPGEETEALGKKARQYNCYILFATFARDAAWPGHFLSLGVLSGPDGTVVARHSLTGTPMEPDIYRALAIKGMKISLRTSSGGFTTEDPLTSSMFNRNYTVIPNNSISPGNPGFPDASGAGGTVIYAPDGWVLAKAQTVNKAFVSAVIPIAEFWRTHRAISNRRNPGSCVRF